jgi:putative acetyltransferase
MFTARPTISADLKKILSLYRKVALVSGGIARSQEEITGDYVSEFMHHAASTGIELVVDHPNDPHVIIAEMHGYKDPPIAFAHVLTNLTIAVDPEFQGQGLGKLMFTHFIGIISSSRPDILRVELVTSESYKKALSLYASIGFVVEGRMEKRIGFPGKAIEADMPMAWFNENFKH